MPTTNMRVAGLDLTALGYDRRYCLSLCRLAINHAANCRGWICKALRLTKLKLYVVIESAVDLVGCQCRGRVGHSHGVAEVLGSSS